jgi:hypothetical protein
MREVLGHAVSGHPNRHRPKPDDKSECHSDDDSDADDLCCASRPIPSIRSYLVLCSQFLCSFSMLMSVHPLLP